MNRVFAPSFGSPTWEKNWQFFGHDGQHYAVYSISPHIVLRIEGNSASVAYSTPNQMPWTGGYLRGGTPQVRHGNEFISFFHGGEEEPGRRVYNVGAYAFQTEPPFAVTRMTPDPILWPDEKDVQLKAWGKSLVVFPAGAIIRNDRWCVSAGFADQRTEILEWRTEDIDAALKPLATVDDGLDGLHGWASPEKRAELRRLVTTYRPRLVVEIGVFGGKSLIPLACGLRQNGFGQCVAIDPWTVSAALEGTQEPRESEWWAKHSRLAEVKTDFFAKVGEQRLWPWVRVLECKGEQAAAMIPESIGLLHLDANHAPEVNVREARLWLPKVTRGGWVIADDTDRADAGPMLKVLEAACHLVRDWGTWRAYRNRW